MNIRSTLRITGFVVAAAIVAAACSSGDTSSADKPLFDAADTTTTQVGPVSTTTEPVPHTTVAAGPVVPAGFVEVTVEEIAVSTIVPAGWVRMPDGRFGDGVSYIGMVAFPTSEMTDPADDGFEPAGQLEAGGSTWQLHRLETAGEIETAALTEFGAFTYAVVLGSPAELADQYLETIVAPLLGAFEAGEIPGANRWFKGITMNTIDVGGRRVAYATGGSGPVTVVFEAGLGNGMQSWALVAPGAAEVAKVFAYDRPGYGDSDLTDSPRDGATVVAELRELLLATDHGPPYVLVGHSLGGTLMDLFARTHPDEVAGVVLVDSRHHEFTARCVALLGPLECEIPTDAEVEQAERPVRDEWLAMESTVQELTDAPSFPQLPLTVIVAGVRDESPRAAELWQQTQQDYADLVPGSRLIVTEHSGHGIPDQEPEVIVDAITDLLAAAGTTDRFNTESETP